MEQKITTFTASITVFDDDVIEIYKSMNLQTIPSINPSTEQAYTTDDYLTLHKEGLRKELLGRVLKISEEYRNAIAIKKDLQTREELEDKAKEAMEVIYNTSTINI
jgi:hypothetical protein